MVTSLFLNSTKQITAQDLFDQINSSYKNTRLNRSKHNKKKHQQELIKKQQRTRTEQEPNKIHRMPKVYVVQLCIVCSWEKLLDELLLIQQKRQLLSLILDFTKNKMMLSLSQISFCRTLELLSDSSRKPRFYTLFQ